MFGLVFAAIRSRPLRSGTAILTVAVAMAIITLTAGGLSRARAFAARAPDYLAVMSANAWLQLPFSDVARLSRLPGVQSVEYCDLAYALDGTPKQNPIGTLFLISPGYFDSADENFMWVEPDLKARWKSEKQGLISNPKTASLMGWAPGQQINLTWQDARTGAISVTPFQYLGTYRGTDPDELIVHYEYVNEILPAASRGRIQMMAVFRGQEGRSEVDRSIEQALAGLSDPTKLGPSREVIAGAVAGELGTVELLEKLAWIMVAITCAILGATTAMSLRERRVEFGTLRALGFKKGTVLGLVMAESAVVGGVALVAGVLIPAAVLLARGHGIDLGPSYLADIRPGAAEILLAVGVALLLPAAVALVPAIGVARNDVVQALQEG